MWHTPDGDRVLRGDEAMLLKAAMTEMAERIKEEANGNEPQSEYGVELFDQLPWSQRLALLARVATYLFSETPETLELTAVNEAAIGALFAFLDDEIAGEIFQQEIGCPVSETETASLCYWRRLVLVAYAACFSADELAELDDEEQWPLPLLDDTAVEEWTSLLELLADRILWDRDYEMGDQFLDVPPELNILQREFLGIADDYFVSVAPDVVSDEEVAQIYKQFEGFARDP